MITFTSFVTVGIAYIISMSTLLGMSIWGVIDNIRTYKH